MDREVSVHANINRREKRRIDITGKIVGRLTIIKFLGYSRGNINRPCGHPIYLCKCECGKEVVHTRDNLNAPNPVRSCGCLLRDENRKRMSKPLGEAAFNSLYAGYLSQASIRKHEFCLTKEEFKKITSSNCIYCGISPSRTVKRSIIGKKFNGDYLFNGIDRLRNDLGYTKENSAPCCWDCNFLKKSRNYNEFISQIKRIYENHIRTP